MKMKNKIVLTGAVILMLVSSSCNKDFLLKNPLDKISSQTFWTNQSEVDMALAGCYSWIGDQSYLGMRRAYFDCLSDGYIDYWGFGFQDIKRGIINSTSGGAKDILYTSAYKGIAACNFFLGNVDNAKNVVAATITQVKAEVRFLRALFYFDLVTCFGDVILYKESPATPEAAKIAKSPKTDVFNFINEDLDFAIANLPDLPYNTGHAVKGSAMGLKVRVLITQQKWSETVNLAQQIINSGTFSLYNNYPKMFNDKASQKNNPEIMFACEYLSPDRPGAGNSYGYNIEYTKHIFPLKKLEDAFECTDGLPISESSLYNPADIFANRDPRHTYIIRNPVGTDWSGFYPYTFYDVTGVQNTKYVNPSVPGNMGNVYLQDWNYILIRYADILLMYAEAKNELSGPDQSVYNAINAVRGRTSVAMPPVNQARYSTKERLREYIQHERFVEFPMEGIRYFDLKRWHIADTVLPAQIDPFTGIPYVFTEKDYYWPFPQFEIDANPNLVQTTGY